MIIFYKQLKGLKKKKDKKVFWMVWEKITRNNRMKKNKGKYRLNIRKIF